MIRAVLLCTLGLLGFPAFAGAQGFFADEDRNELANQLAEATDEQGVCYEWIVSVDGVDDIGSGSGPGRPGDPASCAKGVVRFAAVIDYSCEACEAEDTATFAVTTALADARAIERDLRDLGYTSGDLLSETDDEAAMNMIGALPSILADRAGLPPVPFEPTTVDATTQGMPTDKPGSDALREYRWPFGLGLLLLVGGLGWWLAARFGVLQPGLTPADDD